MNDVMHRKCARWILGILKKSVSWVLTRRKKVDFRSLAEALCRVRRWFGADGKVSIEKCISLLMSKKPFNSKVIKSFVPELRSRKCFSCFGISMLSIYELCYLCALRTLYIHFTYFEWLCNTFIFGKIPLGKVWTL